MKVRVAVCAVLLLVVFADAARAAIAIAWDCYLPSGQVECRTLESAFFASPAYVRATTDAAEPSQPYNSPHASLHVRSLPIADGVEYSFDIHGVHGESLSFKDRVPRGFSNDAVLLRLLGDLQKGTAALFIVDQPATMEDGRLKLTLRDPTAGPRSSRAEVNDSRWYVAPQLGAYASRYGLLEVQGWSSVELNWSHPDWRVRGFSWGNYRLAIADAQSPDDDPRDLRYERVDGGIDGTVVRSFGSFSLAANAYAIHEPQANFDLRAGAWVGAEYVLVPFLKTDEGNLGAHYVFGVEHHDYRLLTATKRWDYTYLRHRASVRGVWHFNRVDLEGRVTALSPVLDLKFVSVSAFGGVTWRVIDDLSFSWQGEVSYRNALLNVPADFSQLHPLEQFYGGGAFGDVTFWTSLHVQYVFGNSVLNRQDQRWR